MDKIGCSRQALMDRLASLFREGMSHATWGGDYGQQLDHIIPQAAYNLNDAGEFRRCWDYRNLAPEWPSDNLWKSDLLLLLPDRELPPPACWPAAWSGELPQYVYVTSMEEVWEGGGVPLAGCLRGRRKSV